MEQKKRRGPKKKHGPRQEIHLKFNTEVMAHIEAHSPQGYQAYFDKLVRCDMEQEETAMSRNTMHFAGTIDSEETMWGQLPDGRHVYVHMLTAYEKAPKALRDNPSYWQQRIENGDFEDSENYPIAWIK